MSKDNGVNLSEYNVGDIVRVTEYNLIQVNSTVRITEVARYYLEAEHIRGDALCRMFSEDIVLNENDTFEKLPDEPEDDASDIDEDNAIHSPSHYTQGGVEVIGSDREDVPMSELYPKYYKDVSHLGAIDVYAVHCLFGIDDPSGAIHHASKKLLLSGARTGGKSKRDDIKEARDTLTRWLDLTKEGE